MAAKSLANTIYKSIEEVLTSANAIKDRNQGVAMANLYDAVVYLSY